MSMQAFINGAWVDVADLAAPSGVVTMFGGTTAPGGWLLCQGQAVSRTVYPSLFQAIGSNFGPGDGLTTFNLPDFRGMFPRGVDGGAGVDQDTNSRSAKNGGNSGDAVGSFQPTATKLPLSPFTTPATATGVESAQHTHLFPVGSGGSGGWSPSGTGQNTPTGAESAQHTHTLPAMTVQGGDHESRPPNLYVNFIIKT